MANIDLMSVVNHLIQLLMGPRSKKTKKDKQEETEQTVQKHPDQKEQKQQTVKVNILIPKKVQYCPMCTFPFELCKYGKKSQDCRKFLQGIAPNKVSKYHPDTPLATSNECEENSQEASKPKPKLEKTVKEKFIVVSIRYRAKKKAVTYVSGLENFKIDSKQLTKKLSKKFACSCSATNANEAQFQGNFQEDIIEILKTEYKVKKKYILDKEEMKEMENEEKEKKKKERKFQDKVIKEEDDEGECDEDEGGEGHSEGQTHHQEKREDQDDQPHEQKSNYKTEFQAALDGMSDGSND